MESKGPINAFPAKSFFIRSLVKDIDLIDAVLDLVDNSIDNHIRNNLKERKNIYISLSETKFVIEDNCGGIRRDKVAEEVFRFGKISDEKAKTIGVFGIGLKRAFFKMGTNILLESDDGNDFFSVNIGKEWLKDENNWRLHFKEDEKSKGEILFRITITELFPNVAEEFKSTYFVNSLINRIKNTHTIFMDERITIFVNGQKVEPYKFKFLNDDKKFAPFHKKYRYDGVDVEIYAGYSTANIETHERMFGWFVFCNDRLILANNLTERTGWGGYKDTRYHYSEDNRFLGLVFFRSDDPILLPWNTAKDNIQLDSIVYRMAQDEMKKITQRIVSVIRLTNRTKDLTTGETIGVSFFEGIPTTEIKDIVGEQQEIVPAVKGETDYDDLTLVPEFTSIQYSKKTSLMKKVKAKLGNSHMSNKKVGEKTFDYYIDMEEISDE